MTEHNLNRPQVNWRFITWSVLGSLVIIMALAYSQAFFLSPGQPGAEAKPRFVVPLTPTASRTPRVTPTAAGPRLAFVEPTITPTPATGGRIVVLTPAAKDTGWVASNDPGDERPNHFGDSFLYAGVLAGQIYHAAFQFDLAAIPRGTKIYAASLALTGLRADQVGRSGEWRLQLLAADIDYRWASHDYRQIHRAAAGSALAPVLTPAQLAKDQVNRFEFTPEQLALLERRLLESSPKTGQFVSFRLDGPAQGTDNLFAWDSGFGSASQKQGPSLWLSIGPPPPETPPPYYVVVTSTPTPQEIMTAVAHSVRMTAAATREGTATPLPPNWVTPFVVTVTPTPLNAATAQTMRQLATAIALTTGEPPNLATATATPRYVLITSTPTPESVLTAAAQALQRLAAAAQEGTATPYPPHWVTPLVVTSTPPPENTATVVYLQAVALTTGTPTPLPANAQTATPTPITIPVEPLASPTATATPTATPQPIPAILLGKIVFLSDREGATEQERARAGQANATPQVTPQPYVFDPATGQLERLTARWPYDVAAAREAWSADTTYEAYTKKLLWTEGQRFTIHFYDYRYNVEQIVTHLGRGIAYDPAWSPVSDEIAFVATESGNDEIWAINRDGADARQLTRNQWEWDKHPSWSPDGQHLVFFSNRTGNNQLWLMNKDGSEQQLVMAWNPYNDWAPVWIKYLAPAPPLERQLDWRFEKPTEEK